VKAVVLYWLALWDVFIALPLHAEQSVQEVAMPGLESDPAGTVISESCAVRVTGNDVAVDMTVKTDSRTPALLINGPQFGWTGATEPYSDRHFPELRIRVDGEFVTPDDRFEAFVGRTNITNLLRAAQMDPWAITRTPPVTSAYPKNTQVLNALKNAGAIVDVGDGYRAEWTARRTLRIALKAAPDHRVELRYTARAAQKLLTSDQLFTASRERTYCISSQELGHFLHPGSVSALLTVGEYTIPTGIDEKPPSSVTFTMQPSAGNVATPKSYVFLCGPHSKPVARGGTLIREPAQVDDQGMLHVLTVAASSPAAGARFGGIRGIARVAGAKPL
jgi:hypothetical protein